MKETHKNQSIGMSLGMCFGVAVSSAFGYSSTRLAMDLCFGMLISMLLGMLKDKKVNEQLRNQGYQIKEIHPLTESAGYELILRNHAGEEMIRRVDVGDFETEEFKIGDMVYIDEDGDIEQAFDNEDKDH